MKAVHLLVNSVLPPDLRNNDQTYDIKSLNKILHAVAFKHPDQFADVEKKISDIGRKASYYQGETITLNDLTAPFDRTPYFQEMEAAIKALPKNKDFESNRIAIMQKYNDLIEKANAKASLEQRNNIAMSVLSGARGKGAQLKAMVATPGTFSDYKGRVVPVFSKESFAEGVRPAVFLASTNGARASVVSTKCLDYQSLVKMADLSEKRLCDIQPGDMVLGADKEGHVFPVKVLNVFDQGEKECYKYVFKRSILEDDSSDPACTVVCTKDHKFLNAKQGCPLPIEEAHKRNYMRPGVKWKLSDGSVVVAVEAEPVGKVHCMDIEVDHPDHLFVLANGLITSNSSTAKGGDLAKQLASSAADLVVRKEDCGTENGIELPVDDASMRGRVLAKDAYGLKAGTVIGRNELDKLKKAGADSIVVRSPQTCSVSNGLCAHCVGRFYNGSKMPKVGDSIGLLASSTVGEPITQMALSAKHTAGMSTGKKSYSGLGTIIQFTQSPEAFKDRGAVSELDGKVTSVEEAPQGGMFVTVDDKKHYVLPGHEVYVKPGDTVEAGDQLAEGLIDPEDIVRLKGLGEGKLYYAERLHQMLQDSGAGTDRRNTEVLARGAIRHIKITDPDGMGSYLPDDVVDYNAVQKTYKVPDTAKEMSPKEAIGKYLQKPYLHYTVGTRVTPTVAKKLAKNKYDSLIVDDTAPGFEPHMVRLRTASHTNPDWMASLATSSIAKQLNEGATRGDDTNIVSNPDFRPRLAVGENFGKNVSSTGEF